MYHLNINSISCMFPEWKRLLVVSNMLYVQAKEVFFLKWNLFYNRLTLFLLPDKCQTTKCLCGFSSSPSELKSKNNCRAVILAALQLCNITYRAPLKVVVQRFVQQRSLAAALCAHQCDVDIIIGPCEPLAPCGHSHRVGRHVEWKLQKSKSSVARKKVKATKQGFPFLLKFLLHKHQAVCNQTGGGGGGGAACRPAPTDGTDLHPHPHNYPEQNTSVYGVGGIICFAWVDLTHDVIVKSTSRDMSACTSFAHVIYQSNQFVASGNNRPCVPVTLK